MKNETERSKDKSKISVLKKKLSSSETVSDEPEKKSRKGKKLKKPSDELAKPGKASAFVRKFNFGKYMTAPPDLSRASSSKSMSSSDTSDRLSSGYSTQTPTSLEHCTTSEEACASDTFVEGEPAQPVSVTPYAISSWRATEQHVRTPETTVAVSHEPAFMDNNPEGDAIAEGTLSEAEKDGGKPENGVETADTAAEAMPAFGNLVMDMVKERPDTTSNISQSGDRKEHLYKILVIGELGTGKTSIIKRYVHQFFSQHYRATIGVDFALKVLNWDANTIIRLQLWDIAGQERFGNMTRVYYKDAVGAFIVFDVTRVATFDAVDKWKQDLDSKVQLPDGSSIPCVLLGNKCDQQKEGIVNTPNRMDEYCKEKGFSGWFETSAKENVNIEEAARFLVNKILQNDKLLHSSEINKDNDRIAIDDKGDANGYNQKSSKTCSC